MANVEELSEYLTEVIDYNATAGVCIWNKRSRADFQTAAKAKAWNTKHAGQEICNHDPATSRIRASFKGKTYPLDKLIWCMWNAEYPLQPVFHLNGQNADNRIDNLTLDRKECDPPSSYCGGTIYLELHPEPRENDYYVLYSETANGIHVFSHHLCLRTAKQRQLELADFLDTSWEVL